MLVAGSGKFAGSTKQLFPCFNPCPSGCRIALCMLSSFFFFQGLNPQNH